MKRGGGLNGFEPQAFLITWDNFCDLVALSHNNSLCHATTFCFFGNENIEHVKELATYLPLILNV